MHPNKLRFCLLAGFLPKLTYLCMLLILDQACIQIVCSNTWTLLKVIRTIWWHLTSFHIKKDSCHVCGNMWFIDRLTEYSLTSMKLSKNYTILQVRYWWNGKIFVHRNIIWQLYRPIKAYLKNKVTSTEVSDGSRQAGSAPYETKEQGSFIVAEVLHDLPEPGHQWSSCINTFVCCNRLEESQWDIWTATDLQT